MFVQLFKITFILANKNVDTDVHENIYRYIDLGLTVGRTIRTLHTGHALSLTCPRDSDQQ